MELTLDFINKYRNTGGFDMIKTGRSSVDPKTDYELIFGNIVLKDKLNGLVIIGGDGTNTFVGQLAEYFSRKIAETNKHINQLYRKTSLDLTSEKLPNCNVIGVPKTIDGDLQNEYIEISFGYDTAVKVYSHLISNICRQCLTNDDDSQAWHFVKLMGRDASQVTLECGLQTQPNIVLIGEEIRTRKQMLDEVTEDIVDSICDRSNKYGKEYGVILIPEGIIGFIPSMVALIDDLNRMFQSKQFNLKIENMNLNQRIDYIKTSFERQKKLTELTNFDMLPREIQRNLLLERDPTGRIQMSLIPTENVCTVYKYISIIINALKQFCVCLQIAYKGFKLRVWFCCLRY